MAPRMRRGSWAVRMGVGGVLGGGVGCVGVVVGDVLFAGEEAEERPALFGGLVPDGSAEGWVLEFEGVEELGDGGGRGDFEGDFAWDLGEGAEVGGEFDADGGHGMGLVVGWSARRDGLGFEALLTPPCPKSGEDGAPGLVVRSGFGLRRRGRGVGRGRWGTRCRRSRVRRRPGLRWCRSRCRRRGGCRWTWRRGGR
jgi:hypothetical protein